MVNGARLAAEFRTSRILVNKSVEEWV